MEGDVFYITGKFLCELLPRGGTNFSPSEGIHVVGSGGNAEIQVIAGTIYLGIELEFARHVQFGRHQILVIVICRVVGRESEAIRATVGSSTIEACSISTTNVFSVHAREVPVANIAVLKVFLKHHIRTSSYSVVHDIAVILAVPNQCGGVGSDIGSSKVGGNLAGGHGGEADGCAREAFSFFAAITLHLDEISRSRSKVIKGVGGLFDSVLFPA